MNDRSPIERPLLTAKAPSATDYQPRGGGNEKLNRPTRGEQGSRLDGKFKELDRLMSGASSAPLTDTLPTGDPELVVVFEVLESTEDLVDAFEKAGLEPLVDLEGVIDEDDLDDEFRRLKPATNTSEPIKRFFHASFANEQAVAEVLRLWRHWQTGKQMFSGYGNFTKLFNKLHNVRAWGPADRIRTTGLADLVKDALTRGATEIPLNIELWYRRSPDKRASAQQSVRTVIEASGGIVLSTAQRPQIGYHGVAATIPTESVEGLANANELTGLASIALLRTPDVLFVRPGGQSLPVTIEGALEASTLQSADRSELGPPLLALLDGVPAANHTRLDGRLLIVDSDDLGSLPTYTVEKRRHGTMTASAAIWGDLTRSEPPASRLVAVRPVLAPDPKTLANDEVVPWDCLPADLMIRAVRDLLGDRTTSGASPAVKIINVSLGDTLAVFDTAPSAWARALDWLSFEYNILFIVAAGNHPDPIRISAKDLDSLDGEDRATVVREALAEGSARRRLRPPAEALNAITVGALSDDGNGPNFTTGYRVDLWHADDVEPSPATAHGRGVRRAIKPDLAAPGGRQLFNTSASDPDSLVPANAATSVPPGVKVAMPPDNVAYTSGTTFAAVEVSRRAARLVEMLEDQNVPDRFQAVSAKALLVHGTTYPSDPAYGVPADRLVGHGAVTRDLSTGCAMHEGSVLFYGEMQSNQQVLIEAPFPEAIASMRELRRLTVTLAWFSPVNWNHRQYRRAKLTFDGPPELPSKTGSLIGPSYQLSQRGTVQHKVIETQRAYAADSLTFTVKCAEQAGGLDDSIPFALALSYETGIASGVDVYASVRDGIEAQIRARVQARV